jgi:Putative prokaryotic signal transducing protein
VSEEGFVYLTSIASVPEAEIQRGRLEAEGIPVMMKGEAEGPYRMGPVHLWVPAALEARARLILDAPLEPISDEELTALAEGALEADETEDAVEEPSGEEP